MVRIVFVGDKDNKRLNILKRINDSILDIITDIKKLPKDVIDLFIVDKTDKVYNSISTHIKSNSKISHIPIISLIDSNVISEDLKDDSDLIVSDLVSDIEFEYYVNTMIKMKIMDDELKKEKIVLELKVKDRTLALENKAERLNITLNSIGDGVIVTDSEGRILSLNPVVLSLFENKTDYINIHINDIFNFFINEERIDVFNIVKSTEKIYKLPMDSILYVNNNKIRISDSASPIFNKKGKFNGMVLIYHDVTDDYEMRKNLIESEKKYKRIYDNVPDIIYTLNLFGIITNVNKNVTQIGYEPNEVIGKNISKFISIDDLKLSFDNIKMKLDDPTIVTKYVINIYTKCGDIKIYEIKTHLIKKEDDADLEIFAIARDVTEHMEFQQKLKESKEKAEKSDKMKSLLISNMSHEIRTPLNSIMGFSDLLITEKDINKISKYSNIIIDSGNQLTKIIEDIIKLSEIESGTLKVDKREFLSNDLLKSLLSNFKKELINRNKENVEIILDEKEDILMYSDFSIIKQIIDNIVHNSIKFTNNGYIKLGFNVIDNMIEYYIHDTGSGINEMFLESVFESFFQVNREKLKKQEGIGLGLSISKSLTEILNGEIFIESEYGIGTSVYVKIPLENKPIKYKTEDIKILNNNLENLKVMVVVEDKTTFSILQLLLLSSLMRVKNSIYYDDIITLIESEMDYDLIIIDINNLSFDGHQLINWIRLNNINIPIVVLSNIKIEGITYCINNPIIATQVIETLKKIFE